MSKQSEAKQAQGYRTEQHNCGSCKHRLSERVLPAWMRRENAEKGRTYDIERYGIDGNRRCGIGGFSIAQTATCNQWEAA